jgi:hypothetical protein
MQWGIASHILEHLPDEMFPAEEAALKRKRQDRRMRGKFLLAGLEFSVMETRSTC